MGSGGRLQRWSDFKLTLCSSNHIVGADQKTTRSEDRAYSLLGLLGMNMLMLCGEGKKAFQRLQLEVIHKLNYHSVLAWEPQWKNLVDWWCPGRRSKLLSGLS